MNCTCISCSLASPSPNFSEPVIPIARPLLPTIIFRIGSLSRMGQNQLWMMLEQMPSQFLNVFLIPLQTNSNLTHNQPSNVVCSVISVSNAFDISRGIFPLLLALRGSLDHVSPSYFECLQSESICRNGKFPQR